MCCSNHYKQYKGYIWRFISEDEEIPEPIYPLNNHSKKIPAIQMKDGKEINRFESISEASRKTGINRSDITRVISGEYKQIKSCEWVRSIIPSDEAQ